MKIQNGIIAIYATRKHASDSGKLIWLGNIGLIDHDALVLRS